METQRGYSCEVILRGVPPKSSSTEKLHSQQHSTHTIFQNNFPPDANPEGYRKASGFQATLSEDSLVYFQELQQIAHQSGNQALSDAVAVMGAGATCKLCSLSAYDPGRVIT